MMQKKWIFLILVIVLLLSACKGKTKEITEEIKPNTNTEQQVTEQEKTSAGILDEENVNDKQSETKEESQSIATDTTPENKENVPQQGTVEEDVPNETHPQESTSSGSVQQSQGDANVMDPPQNNSSGTL